MCKWNKEPLKGSSGTLHSLIIIGEVLISTVNICRTEGMNFLVFTGNRDDIEWHDHQKS